MRLTWLKRLRWQQISWFVSRSYLQRIKRSFLLKPKNLTDTGDIDHPGCAAAILSGLKKKATPSFLIHLTGTGCISDEREQTWEGHFNPRVWNDIEEIQELYNLPDSARHHIIDRDIMDASTDLLRTAIICPPDIYGQNTGIGNRATFLVPEYVNVLLERKEAFYLGAGENMRAVTHIADVVDLFLILLAKALEGGGNAQWGKEVFNYHWLLFSNSMNETDTKEGILFCGLWWSQMDWGCRSSQ